jgi:hypothetical protein
MQSLIDTFRAHVIEMSGNSDFSHHGWFVKYHLNFVEQISLELCERYPEADRDVVVVLVWLHDYAKVLDKEREHDEEMMEKGREKLIELGFEQGFVDKVKEYLYLFEQKMEIDLATAPIEIQIVSSADGASHLVGPFWALYFHENSTVPFEDLMENNTGKLQKDWDRKIVLPEVKKAFQARHDFVKEQSGNFPSKFLTE